MVRPSQLLHPPRTPATPIPAATLLLLRDSEDGLEVLMTRRHDDASFAPGAYVFPGGRVDTVDADGHRLARRRNSQTDERLTVTLTAIRETFEEVGVLLAQTADGEWVNDSHPALQQRHRALDELCAAHGLTLAADQVHLLAHWITDRDLPKRFDVPFLVAPVPPHQTPVADEQEQFDAVWVQPQQAIERHRAGQFHIIFPTLRTLEHLVRYPDVQSLMQACSASEAPFWTSCPRAGMQSGREARFMEHEAAFGELALTCPDGHIAHHLDWQSEQPVSLLKNVQRLTAPNPSFMTGPGTNSYLVGDPDSGFIAIDPGPADAEHIERLWRAAAGDIRHIICTHSHPDHSPGALPLQRLCQEHGRPAPCIWGLSSRPSAKAHSHFVPDREWEHGARLILQGANGVTHTLRAIHTPGHAANHVCVVLEEDGLLFSGDHILNGSTTVIDPPDGHMDDYLNSLDTLAAACDEGGIEFILPAHGHVLGFARQAIAHLKAHRLQRESKIAAAMRAVPNGTPDDWVQLAYDDVPERLWPVAKRSMQAHVDRIQSLGGFNV